MGFLLLQYEFQRASREVTIHQRAGIRLNNQVTRLTKKVKDMQSLFDKQKSGLKTDLQTAQNALTGKFQNMQLTLGIGTGSINWGALTGSFGEYSSYIGGYADSIITQAKSSEKALDTSASNYASSRLSLITYTISQITNIISTIFKAIEERETTLIEEAENQQLAPISEKEADVQADKDLEDTLCSMWEQRRDNAKQKLPDAIKNQMAGYGLG